MGNTITVGMLVTLEKEEVLVGDKGYAKTLLVIVMTVSKRENKGSYHRNRPGNGRKTGDIAGGKSHG